MADRNSKQTKERQELFALYFTTDQECKGNVLQSGKKAGYSEKYLKTRGNKILDIVGIRNKIEEYRKKKKEFINKTFDKNMVTEERILEELFAIGFSDITGVAEIVEIVKDERLKTQSIALKETAKMSKETIKAIQQIKQGANGIEVKMYDKLSALEKLAKYKGMFTDKIEHSGKIDGEHKVEVNVVDKINKYENLFSNESK